jgi:hypothetical protein
MEAYLDGSAKPYPSEDEDEVVEALSADVTLDILPKLRLIISEAFAVPVDAAGTPLSRT